MEYIDIDIDSIPYSFEMTFDNETYEFQINYNMEFDYFTIDLYKNDKAIVLGEKLVYAKPLFLNLEYRDLPKIHIVPLDLNDNHDRISFENFGKDVLLYVVGDEDV